jgi:hypothetical protein
MTGIIFAFQHLQEMEASFQYDFVVYVSSLAFFSIAIIIFIPFMIWWWNFTFTRFKNMRIDAKKRLKEFNENENII